ncbi:MAG TPA: sigma-70 family RNA polymerase sigma factor [Caldilineae bacterium]|nr:sigma-70 family RNA polymerase sigma factor [Caldilineae bacterium]
MMARTATEAELIRRSQQGDEQAFGELVRRYYRLVVSVAYRLCNDPQLAEDIAQETFLKAWQALPRFHTQRKDKDSTSLRAWLCRIAVNTAIDEMRRQRPTVGLEEVTLPDATQATESIDQTLDAEVVRSAIARLPERSRAALILREYEGLSYQEIAEALDIPIGTVMSRLNYARKRLREELENYLKAHE